MEGKRWDGGREKYGSQSPGARGSEASHRGRRSPHVVPGELLRGEAGVGLLAQPTFDGQRPPELVRPRERAAGEVVRRAAEQALDEEGLAHAAPDLRVGGS